MDIIYDYDYGFTEAEVELQRLITKGVNEAKKIIEEYYIWWKPQNIKAINRRELGEDVNTGVVGPFIKQHTTNNKFYISWVTWPRSTAAQRERRKKTFPKHITPWKRGYSENQLVKYCQPWEIKLVMETEEKLCVIRDVIDHCHLTMVGINKLKRVHNKRGNNHE